MVSGQAAESPIKDCDTTSDTPPRGGIVMRGALACVLLVTALTLSGCLSVSANGKPSRGYGPPPHAPAHGYRHRHQEAILSFDSALGVYVVLDRPDHFYFEGRFLRVHAGSWQMSSSLGGPWSPCSFSSLPPGLRKAHPPKARGHGRKGHPPAKARW